VVISKFNNQKMNYKILAVHMTYENNKLTSIAVLWISSVPLNRVRASYATTGVNSGYFFLRGNENPTMDEIQRVAGMGMNLPDNLKKKYFPGKRNWER